MLRRVICAALLMLLMSLTLVPAAAPEQRRGDGLKLLGVEKIWGKGRHNAFTDLVRYRGTWFCTFREGQKHWGRGAQGNIRVIRSEKGRDWRSVALFSDKDGGDLRDPKLVVHPEGKLMLSYFRRFNPTRFPEEHERQYVRFSQDGQAWTDRRAIGSPDRWLWRVTWHEGRAYGISHGGPSDKPPFSQPRLGRLLVSEDGVHFEPRTDIEYGGESTIRFGPGGRAFCLRRGRNNRGLIGTSGPPYTEWHWEPLGIKIGGPELVRLPGGRWLTAVRRYEPKRRTALGWIDPETGDYTEALELPSGGDTSYAAIVRHDGLLWISYYSSHEGRTSIYLAKVRP